MRQIRSLCGLVIIGILSSSAQNLSTVPVVDCPNSNVQPTNQHSLLFAIRYANTPAHNPARDISGLSGKWGDEWVPISTNDTVFRRVAWKPFNPPTIAVQVVVGGGLAAAIAFPVAGKAENADGLGEAIFLVAGSTLAAIVIPVGIYFTGEWMGGDGSYGWTLLGTLVGGGIGVLPNIISGSGGGELFPQAVIFAVIGGITSYHLFASPVYESSASNRTELNQWALAPHAPSLRPPTRQLTVVLVSIPL